MNTKKAFHTVIIIYTLSLILCFLARDFLLLFGCITLVCGCFFIWHFFANKELTKFEKYLSLCLGLIPIIVLIGINIFIGALAGNWHS
jgi:FtsH-binding integral membrane protein